ncbi:kinase-like protein, partial [Dendrothele bispora CBS 962.96]
REVTIWKSLNHRNILPFVGVSLKLFTPSFCMVSPWMNNGHVMSFLKKRPDYNRLTVIYEVVEGVNYLHSLDPPVVHGDIKGSNILVTDDCVCCLADFGLAAVSESHAFSTTSTNPGGTTRWLPPECFLPNQYPDCPKLARDIYSFGCTVLEIISGREPFSQPWLTDVAVMTAVVRGERPQRPEGNPWCTDTLWTLIERCWAQEAVSRPSARHIVDFMREYGNTAQI